MTSSPAAAGPAARVSSRVGQIAESATLAIDAKAKALKAAGAPVISFGAGEPDFPTPTHIVKAAQEACDNPINHKYSPTPGLPELRNAIAAKTLRDSQVEVSASQVLVTNGGKQAVYQAFAALLNSGDEVLLPAPYWTTYPEAIALAGGNSIPVFAGSEKGYTVTVEQLEKARTSRTKVLLLCSPSNPTGAVYTKEQLREIGKWALEHGIWIVSDEIYEHLLYGDIDTGSILSVVPELKDTCLLLNGVAKTYAMTGWRVGWMVGPADVIGAATTLQSHLTSNVNNVAQIAALTALEGGLDDVHHMRDAFNRRRQTMVSMLRQIDGIECPEPQGAFYTFPDVQQMLNRTIANRHVSTSAELAEVILEEGQVALVPGEAFGAPGYLRLSYALGDVDLEEGLGRLQDLLK